MTRRIAVLAICIVAVVALSGCGERDESLSPGRGVVLRVAMAPLNAGEGAVYAAEESGQFRIAGLKAELSQAGDGAAAIRAVTQAKADVAVASEPDLLEARGRGARVVSIAALVQGPFQSLIGPKLSARAVLDLATKPIGTQGLDYQRAFAETIFRKAHVIDVGTDLAGALTSKQVAAVIAPFGGPSLPPNVGVVPVDQLKVPTFSEYVLVANADSLSRNRDLFRSFIGALARGTRNLEKVRQGPVARLLRGGEAARQRARMVPPAGKPYGWQDAGKWRRFAAWMREHKLPQKGSAGAFTNELLPGEGL